MPWRLGWAADHNRANIWLLSGHQLVAHPYSGDECAHVELYGTNTRTFLSDEHVCAPLGRLTVTIVLLITETP
ncbi:MAG: hypothetical protein DCC55_29575 [Chloroflexi bacterium]|nr:MAG: hypothetical protein DCC55_29575 [Chloroflexota bacterium]